uniref:Oxidation resistance protein 1 n=1 Tax=Pinguiococcus pyrenoidosus TaxID=172671 RepID=A0A6U0TZV2_9STRA|mmetsp:Transcript_13703/g.51091  ORF Transcript_13703/g.51091 Transcript_13703/m.51091 type:complete len:404 (+) Transcript_13703:84-1295(+)
MDTAADRAFAERFPPPRLPTELEPRSEPALPSLGVFAASLRLPSFNSEVVPNFRDLIFGSGEGETTKASVVKRRRRKSSAAGVSAPKEEASAAGSAAAAADSGRQIGSDDSADAAGKGDFAAAESKEVVEVVEEIPTTMRTQWPYKLFGFEARSLRRGSSNGSEFSKGALGLIVDAVSQEEDEDGDAEVVKRIVTEEIMLHVSRCLPALVRMHNWKLLYSMRSHGASFSTLARRVKMYENTLLVVHTTNGEVFGGFATRPWEFKVEEKDAQYYGSGQSFLFRVNEELQDQEDGIVQFWERVSVFPWSGRNSYFQLSSKNSLAFGAGGASFGLYIGRNGRGYDLASGSSGACDTYANEPLAPVSGPDFDIVELEMWAPTKAHTELEAHSEGPPQPRRNRRSRRM